MMIKEVKTWHSVPILKIKADSFRSSLTAKKSAILFPRQNIKIFALHMITGNVITTKNTKLIHKKSGLPQTRADRFCFILRHGVLKAGRIRRATGKRQVQNTTGFAGADRRFAAAKSPRCRERACQAFAKRRAAFRPGT